MLPNTNTQMADSGGRWRKSADEDPFQLKMAKEAYARAARQTQGTQSAAAPPLRPVSPTAQAAAQRLRQQGPTLPGLGGSGAFYGGASGAALSQSAPQGIYDQTVADYRERSGGLLDGLREASARQLSDYETRSGQTLAQTGDQINEILARLQSELTPAQAGRLGHVNTEERERLLETLAQLQAEQAAGSVDYAVQQGVDQLSRAEEDAQAQFQALRNQVAAEEATALDNQALYAEARGDRGGIGAAQYASIQNTAAVNQMTVNREQTKLATDTARQIADLRAQGEFKKADELLNISQSYLSQLMQLKQWADEANLSIDEFNLGVEQWEREYNARLSQALAGTQLDAAQYMSGLALERQEQLLSRALAQAQSEAELGLGLEKSLASMGMSAAEDAASRAAAAAERLIAAGVTPTDRQLAAIGLTREQFEAYKAYYRGG